MGCKFLDEGKLFEDPICEVTQKKVIKKTLNDLCRTFSKHTECARYKEATKTCYITSAVCLDVGKPDDCRELTLFRTFRDQWLIKQSHGEADIQDYYRSAPNICRAIEDTGRSKEIYRGLYDSYILPCVNLIAKGDFSTCYKLYMQMVNELKGRFDAEK